MPVIAQLLNISTKLFDNIADAVSANTPTPPASNAALQAVKQAQEHNEGESQWAKRRKLFQLDVNYRWSEVVVDERYSDEEKENEAGAAYGEEGRAARAGDRAPDAPGLKRVDRADSAPTRLFDVFSPAMHIVLVFASSDSSAVQELLAPLLSAEELNGAYRVVVLRPKGSTGLFTEVADEVYEDAEGHSYVGYGIPGGEKPLAVIVRPDSWIGAFATSRKGVEAYIGAIISTSV